MPGDLLRRRGVDIYRLGRSVHRASIILEGHFDGLAARIGNIFSRLRCEREVSIQVLQCTRPSQALQIQCRRIEQGLTDLSDPVLDSAGDPNGGSRRQRGLPASLPGNTQALEIPLP